jgi:hypothetical protein
VAAPGETFSGDDLKRESVRMSIGGFVKIMRCVEQGTTRTATACAMRSRKAFRESTLGGEPRHQLLLVSVLRAVK